MRTTVLALVLAAVAAVPIATRGASSQPTSTDAASGTGSDIWLVELQQPPVAAWRGQTPGDSIAKRAGLAPTSPAVTGKRLEPAAPAVVAYRQALDQERDAVLGQARAALGRALRPEFVYEYALNGMALRLSAADAERLRALPGVRSVRPDFRRHLQTDAGPAWIGADTVWSGAGAATRGEGVVIGVIDSGINRTHPSFAAVGPKDGHAHVNPRGRFFGRCSSNPGQCNAKLIGIHDFSDEAPGDGSDVDGHGSHVASTAAGNLLDHSISLPGGSVSRPISGVAPHANIISYKACRDDDPDTESDDESGCSGSWLIAAIDAAVADGVDIINYSIGGVDPNPWTCLAGGCSSDEVALLNAREAGVLPVVAAGNEGPKPGSATSPGNAPWVLKVANATHDRVVLNRLVDLSGGDTAPPGGGVLPGTGFTGGFGPAPLLAPSDEPLCSTGDDVESLDDGATNPWANDPANRFNGEIVVCRRGTHARVAKSDNVRREGGGGFVLVNTAAEGASTNADAHSIPGTHLAFVDGSALTQWMATGSGHRGRIEGASVHLLPNLADVLSSSSGRGPAAFGAYLIPDLTAPGTSIIAAAGSGSGTASLSGTSMASPHVAGAAALLKALKPQWGPSELASALMTTARADVRAHDGVTPATPFEQGAGVVDVAAAARAGLAFRTSSSDYRGANPLTGGDPKALNEPALVHDDCLRTCTLTRRVTDLAGGGRWRVVASLPSGATLRATPAEFDLGAGATRSVALEFDVTDPRLPGDWVAGQVRFERVGSDAVADAVLPVMVFASPGALPDKQTLGGATEAGLADIAFAGVVALPDARFGATAFVDADVVQRNLSQDATRNDPYDEGTQGLITHKVTVPAGAGKRFRVVAESSSADSQDLDLFVGFDSDGDGKPSLAEEQCRSATAAVAERCEVDVVGSDAAQSYWVLVQNFQSGTFDDVVRLHAAAVDMTPSAASELTVTGPGNVANSAAFTARASWDAPNLLPGTRRYGYLLLGTQPDRLGRTGQVLVALERDASGASAAVALQPGQARALRLGVGTAQERLYVDVPPNASSMTLTTTGSGQVALYAARMAGAGGPVIAAAPPRSAAQASADAPGANETLTVSGAQLAPGRWYVTPVNTGAGPARIDLTATLAFDSARPEPNFGAWFNPDRSGAGVFLYRAGGQWALLLYTYLQDGTPTWYLGSSPIPGTQQGTWTVPLARFAWNGESATGTNVGEAVLTLIEPGRMTFSWNIDGQSGSEDYQWIDGGSCRAQAPRDLTGSWYAPSLSGYGWSINAFDGLETSAVYFYDGLGIARWVFGSAAPDADQGMTLLQFRGACPLCSYASPTTTAVGSFVRQYSSTSTGTGALDIDLVAPLSGNWSTSAPIQKLTDAIGCD